MKKQILPLILLATSFGGMAEEAPKIEDFNQVKAEYSNVVSEKNNFNELEDLTTNKKIKINDLIENEVSGVFKHPYKEGEIMVIKSATLNNIENTKRDKKIKKDLENTNNLEELTIFRHEFDSLSYRGSAHYAPKSEEEKDYNYITLLKKEIEGMVELAKKNGYKQEVLDIIPKAVILHEIGHSQRHQEGKIRDLITTLREKDGIDKAGLNKLNVETYLQENYADSFMLLRLMTDGKKEGKENIKETINGLSDFFINHFRKEDLKAKNYFKHNTKATVHATMSFINNNEDLFENLEDIQVEQLGASITNGVVNNKQIKQINRSYESQLKAGKRGGLDEDVMSAVSSEVIGVVQKMVNIDGVNASFNYKPNAHVDGVLANSSLKR